LALQALHAVEVEVAALGASAVAVVGVEPGELLKRGHTAPWWFAS